jgi:hypothetical protein
MAASAMTSGPPLMLTKGAGRLAVTAATVTVA